MGIAVVLIFYTIAMAVAASAGAVILGGASYLLLKNAGPKRKRAVVASALFPYICAVFAGSWFLAYAVINSEVFHRDPGLGDSWQTPLPNGYALMMIDTTDQGTVYNPKTQRSENTVASGEDVISGVRQLQVSKQLIFGARDTGYFDRIGQESKIVDAYFELNTEKKTHTEYKSLDDLKRAAAKEGVTLHLREFQSVFGDFRTTWFDYLAIAVLLLLPLLGFVVFARWVWSLRRVATSEVLP